MARRTITPLLLHGLADASSLVYNLCLYQWEIRYHCGNFVWFAYALLGPTELLRRGI